MKIRKGRFSGTLGQEVYVNSKYGQVVRSRPQGKFATAANPLGFHVLAWTVPLEATPQPLPAKARTPNHFAQARCRANTPMFGAGWWI
jgi:hypothetical protein